MYYPYGTGNATRCRANELESYGSHSLENGRSNGDVELSLEAC